MKKKNFIKKNNIHFNIKFFYYHCFSLYIRKKTKKLLILIFKRYTNAKKNLKKIYKPNPNNINIIPALLYDKIFSAKYNSYQRIIQNVLIFIKKNNKNLPIGINKYLKNFTCGLEIKYLYLHYFNNLYCKKKKYFTVSIEVFKSFLFYNKFSRNDILILTKKMIFFTTGH
jgi:hypothetical protein